MPFSASALDDGHRGHGVSAREAVTALGRAGREERRRDDDRQLDHGLAAPVVTDSKDRAVVHVGEEQVTVVPARAFCE